MDEPTINPMPKDKVLKALRELKHESITRVPSKYFFALVTQLGPLKKK